MDTFRKIQSKFARALWVRPATAEGFDGGEVLPHGRWEKVSCRLSGTTARHRDERWADLARGLRPAAAAWLVQAPRPAAARQSIERCFFCLATAKIRGSTTVVAVMSTARHVAFKVIFKERKHSSSLYHCFGKFYIVKVLILYHLDKQTQPSHLQTGSPPLPPPRFLEGLYIWFSYMFIKQHKLTQSASPTGALLSPPPSMGTCRWKGPAVQQTVGKRPVRSPPCSRPRTSSSLSQTRHVKCNVQH